MRQSAGQVIITVTGPAGTIGSRTYYASNAGLTPIMPSARGSTHTGTVNGSLIFNNPQAATYQIKAAGSVYEVGGGTRPNGGNYWQTSPASGATQVQ